MQHMEALARANEVRCWRAERRADVKSDGEIGLRLLAEGDWRLDSLHVIDFITWFPEVGRTRARAILRRSMPLPSPTLPETRRLDALTPGFRAALLRNLEAYVESLA